MATVLSTAPSSPRARRSGNRRGVRSHARLVYALPAAILLGLLSAYPLIQLVRMSVSNVTSDTLQKAWPFVGLRNFRSEFHSAVFWQSFHNTLVFVAVVSVLSIFGGFCAAVALRGGGRLPGFVLGFLVFVWALPPVVNGSVWKFLLADDGLVNVCLRGLGMHGSVPFLYDPHLAIYSVAMVNTWAVIPFNALVFRAALLGVERDVLEAAKLDGVRPWQEIRFVYVPAARRTLIIASVLTIVYAFRSFDFIYVMTSGGPGTATNTLPYLGYSQAFVQFDYGPGSAVAVVAALLVVVLALVYGRSVLKEERTS